MKTPIVYWRAHFLSEQEKKRRIPTMKYDSLLYVVSSEDFTIGQHDKCETNKEILWKRGVYTVKMPAIYSIYSQTSFSTNLIEVVVCAMLSFKGFSAKALQVSSCLQDSTSSNQKTRLTDQRGLTHISAALCLGSNNLSAST